MKLNILLLVISLAAAIMIQGCSSKDLPSLRLDSLGNGICHDTESGLMWQCERSEPIKTIETASFYAKKLSLGGYHDWRLPTRGELLDLNNWFDLHLNGECSLDREGNYWSWERSGKGMVGAWEVSATECDSARHYIKGTLGRVRAVRP